MSNLPWLKLYTEARTDRKLACLTRAEKGVWIDLLMYAADQDERGTFDASDRYTLAMEVADGDEELLNSTIEKLLKVRHIVPCGLYVTSETSGNDGNEYVTAGNSLHSLQRYIFRTFAARQAQKISNYPSDAKERINERVRKHRALKKQAQLQGSGVNYVTSETSGNDTDRDREGDREYPLSGKVILNDAAVGALARSTAASGWNETQVKQISRRIAGRLKMVNPDMDGLSAILQQHPCAAPYLEAEAAKCHEWHSAKGRKVTIRLFDNWLAKAETRQEQERLQQQALLNGKVQQNGSQQQPPRHATTEPDALYNYHQRQAAEAAATRAKMVS